MKTIQQRASQMLYQNSQAVHNVEEQNGKAKCEKLCVIWLLLSLLLKSSAEGMVDRI